MFFTVYKIINKINGNYYIGQHKTDNLNDGYMGSGKCIDRAIGKYGIDNFEKQIIYIFNNAVDMIATERDIVNEIMLADPKCYNMKLGGTGGFDHINNDQKYIYTEKARQTIRLWPVDKLQEITAKKVHVGASNGMYGSSRSGVLNPNYGKNHTEETKQKISNSNKGKTVSDETRQKLSTISKARWTEEAKLARSISYKMNPKTKCGGKVTFKGTKWWNDGTISIRCVCKPDGDNWLPGRIGGWGKHH